jgi:hypothetical protein
MQITERLTEILQDLAGAGGPAVAMSSQQRLDLITDLIMNTRVSTPKVLLILESAS